MSKNNSRSFRYSDEVAKIIENAIGANYSEKFENLVLSCHEELPKVQKYIKQAEAELDALTTKCTARRAELVNLNQLEMERHAMQSQYAEFMDCMRRFAAKTDKL